MAKGKRDGLLIVGGGLTGSLAALAMARSRPEVPILLVEESDRFGGDHIWSFLEGEVEDEQRWLVDPLISLSWAGYYVSFPEYSRKLRTGFHSIRSADLDAAVRQTLRPEQYRLNTKVVAVRENELVLPGGEKIKADGAIDARGAANLSMLDLGWRKFVGHEYHFPRPHRVDLPVMMDATIDQLEGYHFFHCLPISEDRLLVQDTYYSDAPDLDLDSLRLRIQSYLELRGWKGGTLEREESGILPIPLGDDLPTLWRGGGARVAKLGARGGFFHPFTGSSLPDAVLTAILISEHKDFSGAALNDLLEAEAGALWRKRDFYRMFNGALFDASVWDRRKMVSAFYRTDPGVIERFYSGKLGMIDRRRISSLKAAG